MSNSSLPSPWYEIVNQDLLKYFVGPCPVCSANATAVEQLVWPIIKLDDSTEYFRVVCPHDNECHTRGVGWFGGSPAGAIIDWNQKYWSDTRYDFRSVKQDSALKQ